MSAETIYALSSGQPPAAIAVIRVSGPMALKYLGKLTSSKIEPRRATLVSVKDDGVLLDRGLAIFFPGPHSATGEDVVELHLHGGRAVVGAVLAALERMKGARAAEPGEFTRRALEHGRIDLTEAEGLADLLEAQTESQRRAALLMAGGALSRQVGAWSGRLLALAAAVEAALDFADEGDVEDGLGAAWEEQRCALAEEIRRFLSRPPAERLKEGVRVVIAGPPNAGKSTLLNALVEREAAITSDVAGTTRDLIEAPVSLDGIPFLFIDSAGLRGSGDKIEAIGVARARAAIEAGDLILWLGAAADRPSRSGVITVGAKSDVAGPDPSADIAVSAVSGAGMAALVALLVDRSRTLLPVEDEVAIKARHRGALADAIAHIEHAGAHQDLLIVSEELRQARLAFDRITGHAGVEDMLDALFGRFCIGK